MPDGVSMFQVSMASPFLCLRRCSLRCFWVSVPAAFLVSGFYVSGVLNRAMARLYNVAAQCFALVGWFYACGVSMFLV
jgi:hypothetical protein